MRRLAQTLELGGDVDQFTLIAVAGWQDHGLGDLQRRQGLGVDVFAVAFHVDVVPAAELTLGEHTVLLEQGDVLWSHEHVESFGRGLEVG